MIEKTHEERVEEAVLMFSEDRFVRDLVIIFDAEFDSVEVAEDADNHKM